MSRRIIRTHPSLRVGLAALPLFATHAGASYTSSWVSPVSGDWNDVTKWSTSWSYPNNATNTFSATINAAGNPYAVRFAIPQGVSVDKLNLDSPDATFLHSAGTLALGSFGLRVGAGARYELSGGTLSPGTSFGGRIGYGGAGTFVQTGGTVLQRASVVVGSGGGSLATGVGSLLMDGHRTYWVAIGAGSTPATAVGVYQGIGTMTLTNNVSPQFGPLTVGSSGGQGTLIVSGSARVTAEALAVGADAYWGQESGTGTVLMDHYNSSITLTGSGWPGNPTGMLIVGGSDGVGAGTMRVSTGTIQAMGAAIGRTGTFNLSGGRAFLGAGASVDGNFLLSGNGIVISEGFDLRQHGRFDVSGGSFTVSRFNMSLTGTQSLSATGGLLSVGSFAQGTGVSTFAGTSVVSATSMGVAGDARFNLAGAVVSSPVFRLSGGTANYSSGTFNVASLTITGGRFTLAPGANVRLDVNALDVRNAGVLDLGDNRLTIDYAGPSPLNEVRADLARAHAGGAWTGSGITSGMADATTHGLGYVDVAGASVIVRLTRYGDADLDRVVGLADFNALASHFGEADAVWSEGDFNYDAVVNLRDFNRLAANFGQSAASEAGVTPQDWANLAAAVPEPGVVGLLTLGAPLLGRRRRRDR